MMGMDLLMLGWLVGSALEEITHHAIIESHRTKVAAHRDRRSNMKESEDDLDRSPRTLDGLGDYE